MLFAIMTALRQLICPAAFSPVSASAELLVPTAATTFSTTADLVMTTLPDIADCGFKMSATKTELEITVVCNAISKAATTFSTRPILT